MPYYTKLVLQMPVVIRGAVRVRRRDIHTTSAISAENRRAAANGNLGSRLQALRCVLGTTQSALAERLGISQTALSHMEQREDLLLSTLAAYVGALGGKFQVSATFPNADPVLFSGDACDAGWPPVSNVQLPVNTDDHGQLRLPNILGDNRTQPQRDIIFSIRPPHAEKILAGTKTVELRRRFTECVKPGALALIYTTSPTRALTGFAKIRDVQRLAVSDLWKRHRMAACVRKGDFEAYFAGLDRGYAIILSSAQSLKRPVGLSELRERFGFGPPQSFQYASPHIRGLVEHEWQQNPH